MKKTVAVVTAVAFLGATIFASPYWAVHQMQAAARAGDGDRLEQYVDFPAVRESLKAQLAAAMDPSLVAAAKDNPLASMGQALAATMIGPMVDAMVTPQSVATMINRGKAPPRTQSGSSSDTAAQPAAGNTPEKKPRLAEGYAGLDVFKVSVRDPDTDKEAVAFVLNREGWLGWKLTEVRLPGLGAAK